MPVTFWCKLWKVRWRDMMPQDSLTLALTTGLGFSVLAGIFSGVVYIISSGYGRTKRPAIPDTPWHCSLCGAQFRSIDGVLENEDVITCIKCSRRFCKQKCSKQTDGDVRKSDPPTLEDQDSTEHWICRKCQPDSWLTGFMRLLKCREPKVWYTKKMTTERNNKSTELLEMQRKEREQVRDFIERLVEALLGGELDNVSVKKIYNDERYLPIAGETPCSTHASLKKLIQRFIREASELPELRKFDDGHPSIPDDTNDRNYEDLLSTAIINKVVQNYQNQPKPSSVPGKSSFKRGVPGKEYFLGERNLDKFTDDGSSVSSFGDYINTNHSIHQSIEEEYTSDEDPPKHYDGDEIDSASIRNNEWQENWYLRKRNFASGSNSPAPVPMLVPNPTNHAKVLIGDRDADDTTDLSDAFSDYEDELVDNASLNAVLINSKSLIGGHNPLESLVAKAESISNEEFNNDKEEASEHLTNTHQTKVHVHAEAENDSKHLEAINGSLQLNSVDNADSDEIVETCNVAFIRDNLDLDAGATADVEDHSLISLECNTEKDLEYTEKYATLPRKIPMPTPRQSKHVDVESTNPTYLIEDLKTENADSGVTSDEDDKQKSFKSSTYGEREKDKWNHAIELPNNPYSKSNLERRLSNRSSSISSLNSYGADYFAKAAGRPRGGLKKDWMQENINDLDADADDEERISPMPVDDPVVPEENIFHAVPAIIKDEDHNVKDEESSIELSTPSKKLQPWDFSSDSDYSIERTYNINSGKIIKKKGELECEIPSNEDDVPGITPKEYDENQNNQKSNNTHLQRTKFLRSLTNDDSEIQEESDLSPITPPAVNHYKLVNEIANESSDDYKIIPISPPAEYKTEPSQMDVNIVENKHFSMEDQPKENAIEYESYTKSFEFTIDDDCDTNDDALVYEESMPSQLIDLEDHQEISDNRGDEPLISLNESMEHDTKKSMEKQAPSDNVLEPIEEIGILKKKQVVKNLLNAFSKSYPNLSTITKSEPCTDHYPINSISIEHSSNENDIEIEDASLESVPSVHNLKKKFEDDSDVKKEVHSLTARSLPKHVRQELAAQKTPRLMQHSNNLLEVSFEAQEEEVAFPKARSKIAYFEQMNINK